MNVHAKKAGSLLKALMLIGMSLLLIGGCQMRSKTWIDQMLSEMEAAWIRADNERLGQTGRDAAVTGVAQKYFRPGMSKADAFERLHQLKANGYEIQESRYEGKRVWPDGELRSPWTPSANPHVDETTVRNVQRHHLGLKGVTLISVHKMYGRERVFIEKNVSIGFKIIDNTDSITDVTAIIWAHSI